MKNKGNHEKNIKRIAVNMGNQKHIKLIKTKYEKEFYKMRIK